MRSYLWVLTGCLITGCTMQPAEPPTIPKPQLRGAPVSAPAPYNARQTTVPKGEEWLLDIVQLSYKSVPATFALKKIADQYPLRILFDLTEDPPVSAPKKALTVQDHLQAICSQANWAYTVAGGVILISDMETKTFRLAIQPGRLTSAMPLNSLNGQATEGTGAENTAHLQLDPYVEEVKQLLDTVLLEKGDSETAPTERANASGQAENRTGITVLPSANAVIISARPDQMRRIEQMLEVYMEGTAKSVSITLTFYEVVTTDDFERHIDFNLLRTASSAFGIRIFPADTATNPSSLSFEFNDASSKFNGSSIVGRWLNTVGDTSITFQDQVEVRNNTVATMNSTTSRQYVRSISREQTSSGDTTLLTPTVNFDTLNTGWSISVQPTIVGDQITVNLAISRSNFLDEMNYSFDDGRIAGTSFVTSDFNRRMAIQLQNGVTKLLSSLNSSEVRNTKARTPWLPFIGDRVNRRKGRREIIMMITATVQ